MTPAPQLVILNGPEAGRGIVVPLAGIRVGRGEKNDLVIDDAAMSRHHCRFSLREGVLYVTDLGSANPCTVNGQEVDEVPLKKGDVVVVGGTEFRVEGMEEKPAAPTPPAATVDLGLSAPAPVTTEKTKLSPLAWVGLGGVALVAVIVAIMAPRWMRHDEPVPLTARPATLMPLHVVYEKVTGSSSNILYYRMELGTDHVVSVQMDDLVSKRHVVPEKKRVDPVVLARLAQRLSDTGFFALDAEYRGIRAGDKTTLDLSITTGRRTHRARVINRAAPDAMARAGEMLEEFCKNELGLWAADVPPEKLIEMANDAFRLGKRLYDERQVKQDNLARALKSYREAEWCLQTVEPKPAIHTEILDGIDSITAELEKQYQQHKFEVERAIRLREWEAAQRELLLITELIPDTADPRHAEARTKLLDVEKRLRTQK